MLTFIKETGQKTKDKKKIGLFRCDCGNETEAIIRDVRRGKRKSCGCTKVINENLKEATALAYKSMICRCYNKNTPYYKKYGGRGITVCEYWLQSYENFLQDMGEKPLPELSLHRKNNDLNYCKDNCEWATKKVQGNEKTNSRKITFNGKTQTLTYWAEDTGIGINTLRNRLQRGYSVDDLFATIGTRRQTDKIYTKDRHRLNLDWL